MVRTGRAKSREGKRAWPRLGSVSVKQNITPNANNEIHIAKPSTSRTRIGQMELISSCGGFSGPIKARLKIAQTGIAARIAIRPQRFFRQISQRMASAGEDIGLARESDEVEIT